MTPPPAFQLAVSFHVLKEAAECLQWSSHGSSRLNQWLDVNVNTLMQTHMMHICFLPNIACNLKPDGPHYPSLPSIPESCLLRVWLGWGWHGARWQWLIEGWLMAAADAPALLSIVLGFGTSHLVKGLGNEWACGCAGGGCQVCEVVA